MSMELATVEQFTKKITWGEIDAIVRQRQVDDAMLIRQMQIVRDRTEGDYIIPFGNVGGSPKLKPPVAQKMTDAIDGNAMRAGSVDLMVNCPALDPTSDLSVKRANQRKKFVYGTWKDSAFNLVARRAYRQYGGYGTFCLIVEYDPLRDRPRIEIRDALYTYPEPQQPEEYRPPKNVAFIYGRTAAWLKAQFGAFPGVNKLVDSLPKPDSLVDIVEWIDENERVIGVLGARRDRIQYQGMGDTRNSFELCRWTNYLGIVPVVTGKRVTLSRIASQVSPLIATLDMYERLSTLETIAIERSVFPDKVVIGKDGMPPVLVNGRWYQGHEGKANFLQNVANVQVLNESPSQMVGQKVRQLEADFDKSAGNPGIMTGQYGSEMRSGSVAGAIGSFAIDPRVQEMQQVFEYAATTASALAIEMAKNKDCGSVERKQKYYSGWQTDNSIVVVDFDHDLETSTLACEYPVPGGEVGQITISAIQGVGAEILSRKTGRTVHPLVKDADFEERQITLEAFDKAMRDSHLALASQGAIQPIESALIKRKLKQGMDLDDAIIEAQKEAQEKQATAAPPPGEGQVAAPETMPGIGGGVQQPSQQELQQMQAPVQQPGDGLQNAQALFRAMRAPAQQSQTPVGV